MNEESRPTRLNSGGGEPEEREVQRLLAAAGRRPAVPAAEMAAIRTAAHAEWRRLLDAPSPRRRLAAPLALAASLVLAVAVGWWWLQLAPPAAPETVATVELIEGPVPIDGLPLALGGSLTAGAELATGSGGAPPIRLAVRLAGGQSVRLDSGSRVRLLGRSSLELLQGALYVDSAAAAGAVEIQTAYGNVVDIGTQFEVRLASDEAALRVRVRAGSVALRQRGDGSHSAAAGEELTVRPDGSVARATVAAYGGAWEWVVASAPSLDIEGLSLEAYLDWVARETGWQVRFEDPSLAELAAAVELHGSIEGLAPDESLAVVLPSVGLDHRLEDGVLVAARTGR